MSPTDPPTQPPADLGVLARDLDRLTRQLEQLAGERVGDLEQSLQELWGLVRALADRLQGEEDKPRVNSWFLITDEEQAVETLDDLVEWLEAVYLRYAGSELPGCWMWHDEVIEELRWLRRSHDDAYKARMWGVPAGMWHDQQRPRVVERIQQLTATCDLEKHVSPGRRPAAAPLKGHIKAIARARVTFGRPPEPTAEQLQDSYAYDSA